METPKQKSEILIDKYLKLFSVDLENTISQHEAVECAKIAVEEIIKYGGTIFVVEYPKNTFKNGIDYWQEVKTELNKL